ncbi:MAG: 2-hydroxyglutaryl-CoA dehydratase, partial [Thermodesulfobacteriota bacterium]
FQGGVAANQGIKKAFERELGEEIFVPEYYHVMGAIGAALLAKEKMDGGETQFKGFGISDLNCRTANFICRDCENHCEVVEFIMEENPISYWGDRCGKWESETKKF